MFKEFFWFSLRRRLNIPEHPIYILLEKERTRSSKRDQASEREKKREQGQDDVFFVPK